MTITPSQINKAITLASDIARPSPMPALSHIVLGDGQIVASDLENQISIQAPFDFAPYMVPAAKFKSILSTIPQDMPLKLEHKDGKLSVKSGRSKFGIQTLPAEGFPMMETGDFKASLELDQASLKKMLHDVQHAMADKDVRQYLNGVLLEVKANELTCVATNTFCLAKRSAPFVADDMQIILPRHTVLRLQKILNDGPVTLNLFSEKAEFVIGGTTLLTKLAVGKFPDYRRAMPKPESKIRVDREIFTEAFNRSAVVLEKFRAAKVTIGPMIGVTCQFNGEVASDEFESTYTGQPFTIALDVDQMRQAMAALGGDEVEFGFTNANNPITLANDDLLCVVMQMKV